MFSNKYFYLSDNRVGKMFPYLINDADSRHHQTIITRNEQLNSPKISQSNLMSVNRTSTPPPKSPQMMFKKRESINYDYKSEAVKNIELIAKSRDERRQKLADEKAIKEQQFNAEQNTRRCTEFYQMIKEYRNTLEINPIKDSDQLIDNQIVVCVRKRPLNSKEANKNEIDVITTPTKDQLVVHEPKHKVDLTKYLDNHNFRFDYVFDDNCSNNIVYKFTAKPLVQTIFDGGMATCFAYGQTGAGKTHTMGGEFKGKQQNFKTGIYGLVATDIFATINQSTNPQYLVTASFFEIYGKFAYDLLAKRKRLKVLEDGKQIVQVIELSEHSINKIDDVFDLIRKGSHDRTSGQTSANTHSSRSHAVFQIILRKLDRPEKIFGKFSLIDLAGNERGADTTNSNRQTCKEGADINRSLLALKECIRALGKKGKKHCPFRESILTKILRDSFIGEKSKTCMIAMISPNFSSVEHTLNTLRYADRVKELAANNLDVEFEDNSSDLSDSENDLTKFELDVLENSKEVLEYSLDFHKKAMELYRDSKRNTSNKKLEFAQNWRKLLKNMIDVQNDAYVKVTKLCELLEDNNA